MRRAQRAPADKAYRLDIRPPMRRHSDPTQYTVLALWMIGFSASSIARTCGLRRSQVLGIAHRSGFEMRSTMTDQERQSALDDLREIRFDDGPPLDGGRLDGFDWKIIPIEDGRKKRPARTAAS